MRPIHSQPAAFPALALGACLALAATAPAQTVGPEPPPAQTESRPLGAPDVAESTPLGLPDTAGERRPIGERRASGLGIGRTAGAVGLVAGLALAGYAIVRVLARAQGGLAATMGPAGRAPSGVLEVLGRYPVGRGQTLVLLRVDRRVLLLSQTATGRLATGSTFSTLCEVTEPEDVASLLVKARDDDSEAASNRFSSMLGRHERAHDEGDQTIPVIDLTKRPGRGPIDRLRQRWADARPATGGAQR